MAVVEVQKSAYGNVGGGANAVAFAGVATIGNTIIVPVFIVSYVADPTSVTDNLGNTYTKDGSGAAVGAGSVDRFMVYRSSNLANTPLTITVTVAQATKTVAYEVSGLSNSSPLDVFSITTEAATLTPSRPFTSNAAGEFACGILSTNNGGSGKTFTAGTGWTLDSNAAGEVAWFESKVLGAAGAYNLDGTISGLNGLWDAVAITYKAPSAAVVSSGFRALLALLGAFSLAAAASLYVDIPGPAGALGLALAWDLPFFNADGSALSPPITNQRIVYDTVSRGPAGGHAYVKYINDGTTTSITIPNLAAGTYYCAMQTYDGQWSELTPEFAKAAA